MTSITWKQLRRKSLSHKCTHTVDSPFYFYFSRLLFSRFSFLPFFLCGSLRKLPHTGCSFGRSVRVFLLLVLLLFSDIHCFNSAYYVVTLLRLSLMTNWSILLDVQFFQLNFNVYTHYERSSHWFLLYRFDAAKHTQFIYELNWQSTQTHFALTFWRWYFFSLSAKCLSSFV